MTEKATARSTLRGKRLLLGVLMVLAGAGLGFLISQQWGGTSSRGSPPESATILPAPKPLQEFELVDHTNSAFTNRELLGKWTFLFFGYTNCPDICPETLGILNETMRDLSRAGEAQGTRVVFVSVDHQRDTPGQLARFVSWFHPGFIGVTGKPDQLANLARQLGIAFQIHAPDSPGRTDYRVDHSASVLLLDPRGSWYALFSPPHDPRRIASDFRGIRARYP